MAASTPFFVQWGVVSITGANLVVLGLMILTFTAAVVLRLPEHRPGGSPAPSGGTGGTEHSE